MQVLLDTNVLIWALDNKGRLNERTQDVLTDPGNVVLFSAASLWEIAIKAALGRADFAVALDAVLHGARASGFIERPVTSEVALRVATLPLHHRDPFDRLLVAQAMAEPAVLYTADRQLTAYSPDLVVAV